MPKIPRDISGKQLIKLLKKFGYRSTRQTGSHIRLLSNYLETEHKITIPAHSYIKIKTLNNILNEISEYLEISKEELLESLFG
jgi:predicted RNA binding protein YcfA (HicA-like mRNA interferase family)